MEPDRRVEQISALVAELRLAAGDGPKTRELIDSIFRAVHTFKAAAGAEGLNHAAGVAHELENLLHDLRTGKIKLNEDVLRVFEDTTAALRGDFSLQSEILPLSQPPNATDENSDTDLLPLEFAGLKDDERHRAASALREGAKLYVMEAVFEVGDFDERFRQLKAQLEKNAELISSSPTMQDDQIIFRVVYASKSEKIPFQKIVHQTILAGKATAAALDKKIVFVAKGDELLLDKSLADALVDVLLHLVRNAVDHGIETRGTVVIEVSREEVSVTDDGRGIAPEDLPRIFQPGFSTADEVTEVSGRGVGLDAVAKIMQEIGGDVTVTSEPTKGSSFKINLPNQ